MPFPSRNDRLALFDGQRFVDRQDARFRVRRKPRSYNKLQTKVEWRSVKAIYHMSESARLRENGNRNATGAEHVCAAVQASIAIIIKVDESQSFAALMASPWATIF
jgi:hypothetical protein